MPERPDIFLLTDFGTTDHYVAVMKAVIISRCPPARIVDISHHVPPQDIEAGSYLLESLWPWLPPSSTVLAVVDPGVGSSRQSAVFYHDNKTVIAPNNGLLRFLPAETEGRVLDKPEYWLPDVSSTFHGRDIFAPCAAFIAAGGHWTLLGNEVATPAAPAASPPLVSGEKATGRIIHFDHFGNAITNIRYAPLPGAPALVVEIPGQLRCTYVRTYTDVKEGTALAYTGSTGRIEIAVRNGNARQQLGLQLNDQLYIEPGALKE